MLLFYLLSFCFGIDDFSNVKDIVFWTRQQDLPILGIFKEPVDSSKDSLFRIIANHFETSDSGLSFGRTTLTKAWDRYDLPEDTTSAIVIHANYYEEDGAWRSRGSTKIVYDSDWTLAQIVLWVTSYSFPPAIDIRHLMKGGADAQRRGRFLLGVDMPKISWLHDGLTAPDFFVRMGKHLRGKILLLIYDTSENENLGGLVDSGGWLLTSGLNPLDIQNMWGEYDGELNEEDVKEWIDEVVVLEHLTDYVEQQKKSQAKKKKKKNKKKKKRKKEL
jgi:hypothetical protein